MSVQSVLFDKRFWTLGAARKWCRDHEFADDVDEKPLHYRFRQFEPDLDLDYRTKKIGHGIEFVVAFRRNKH